MKHYNRFAEGSRPGRVTSVGGTAETCPLHFWQGVVPQ